MQVVRACVGMKFPHGQPLGTEPRLEEIPIDDRYPQNLYHGDMHGGNGKSEGWSLHWQLLPALELTRRVIVLIGAPGDFREHALIPPVKLIDFAFTTQDSQGDQRNLMDASRHMLNLITGQSHGFDNMRKVYKGVETTAIALLPYGGQIPYPTLDPELRDLVISCLAYRPDNRPALERVFEICKNGVRKGAAFYGRNAHRETDEAVRNHLQQLLFNVS
ncbi:putative kinase domain protein [Rosellinia necatrix]|uniref:Putative kinase domain protein n=1 Tax=Rosellinia necatrix TaxID=77044 RepID=A0A1S8AAP1_ROSNE|nr:putative kinase domain protein [Rosellinia necatrix]